MNEIMNINIAGIVFHVNDDAYKMLKDYIKDINKHFSNTSGGDEIISDIEARVAELFQQKLSSKKEVISVDDVVEIMSIMGKPSDFEDNTQQQNTDDDTVRPKRLFRDIDNGMVGGVCSGLGAYFRIDMVWLRIGFVIATFSGLSILAYIILWIIIPPARTVAEKLEMKGDPVTISNIEKSIRKEMGGLRDKFDDFATQARDKFKRRK